MPNREIMSHCVALPWGDGTGVPGFGSESPLNIALEWLDEAIPDDPDTNIAG
jgi:hypothetical protein